MRLAIDNGNRPRLYFVKMDIIAAFDTIRQNKMLEIVTDILDKVRTLMKRFS